MVLPRPRALGRLEQVRPRGRTLQFHFDPAQLDRQGGVGGWQEVAHPRAATTVEWQGTPARSVELDLLFDGYPSRSVEPELDLLDRWGRPVAGSSEPPVLRLVYGTGSLQQYVLNGLDFSGGEQLRRSRDGLRVRQGVRVVLLGYAAATLALTPVQRAAAKPRAAGAAPKPSGRTYVTKAGDTLGRVAQAQLGDHRRWRAIWELNKKAVPDPDRVKVGLRLRLP